MELMKPVYFRATCKGCFKGTTKSSGNTRFDFKLVATSGEYAGTEFTYFKVVTPKTVEYIMRDEAIMGVGGHDPDNFEEADPREFSFSGKEFDVKFGSESEKWPNPRVLGVFETKPKKGLSSGKAFPSKTRKISSGVPF